MRSRFVAIGVCVLGLWACSANDDNPANPSGSVEVPHPSRDVVDAGLIVLDMDADVYGVGGGTGLYIPDAGARRDLAPALDAAVNAGGAGAACEVFATNPCSAGYGCYPKSDGSGSCQQAGSLPGGSRCEPNSSSPDSRCIPGYVCVTGICAGLCHLGQASTSECADSIGTTCTRVGTSTTVGYCGD